MLTNQAKILLNTLKSDEELKFWDYVEYTIDNTHYMRYLWEFVDTCEYGNWELLLRFISDKWKELDISHIPKNMKILWQANFEHLLMYLKKKNINSLLWSFWNLCKVDEYNDFESVWMQFNLKKPLLEQDESVLKKVNIYLNKK